MSDGAKLKPCGECHHLVGCLDPSFVSGCFLTPLPLGLTRVSSSPSCPLLVSTRGLSFLGNEQNGDVVENSRGLQTYSGISSGSATLTCLIPHKLPSLAQPHVPHLCVCVDNSCSYLVGLLKGA